MVQWDGLSCLYIALQSGVGKEMCFPFRIWKVFEEVFGGRKKFSPFLIFWYIHLCLEIDSIFQSTQNLWRKK